MNTETGQEENERSYRAWYEAGKRELAALPEAALDARLLLEDACGTTLQTLLLIPDRPVSREEAALYQSYLARRKNREPLAMIVGHTGFMGLDFLVNPSVLIPEQDTEILVEEAIAEAKAAAAVTAGTGTYRLLDLCTGSGCIVLSFAHYYAQEGRRLMALATDLSAGALAVAGRNAAALGWVRHEGAAGSTDEERSWWQKGTARLEFRKGDLFAALGEPDGTRYDMIVSNPPYIPEAVIPTLAPEVRQGEPYLALCGGADGLSFYRRIAASAADWLVPGGRLLLEIGWDQGEHVPALLREQGFEEIQVRKDYGGRDRVVCCRRKVSYV